jgi:tetratricopeptide (TPR) repeat protein
LPAASVPTPPGSTPSGRAGLPTAATGAVEPTAASQPVPSATGTGGAPASAGAPARQAPALPEAVQALLRKAEGLAAASDGKNADAVLAGLLVEHPDQSVALLHYGVARLRAGHFDQALEVLEQCVTRMPNEANGYKLLGIALFRKGRHDEAITRFEKATALNARDGDTWFYWAQTLAAKKDFNGALTRMAKANAVRPDHAPYLHTTGTLLSQAGADKRALPILFRALDLSPTLWAARMTLAHVLMRLNRHKEAISHYAEVLQDAPDRVDVLSNIGNAYAATDQYDTAYDYLQRLVTLHPDDAGAHSNLANLYSKMNRYEESVAAYEKALELRPIYPEALNNFAITLRRLNRTEDSIKYLERAIEQREGFPDANWNRALSLLLAGRLEEGFEAYEWRWRGAVKELRPRKLSAPIWKKGDSIAGKRLLIHSEQGLGDHIQYMRFMPQLRALGAQPIMEIPEPLLAICQDFDPATEWSERGAKKLPAYDLYAPMMSLTHLLGTNLQNIPSPDGYFRTRPDKVAHFRSQLADLTGLKVGLVWSGNPKHMNDRNRSLSLAPMLGAFGASGAHFISVMKEVRPSDRQHMDATGLVRDFSAQLNDFTDTAALIECLDVVISVDTSVAHIAGAIGRPVWMLLPFSPDWRWMNDRPDTPWYSSMKLIRQANPHDWDSALASAAAELMALAKAKGLIAEPA